MSVIKRHIASLHPNNIFNNGTANLLGEGLSTASLSEEFPSNHMESLIYVLQAPNTVLVCILPETNVNMWV